MKKYLILFAFFLLGILMPCNPLVVMNAENSNKFKYSNGQFAGDMVSQSQNQKAYIESCYPENLVPEKTILLRSSV